MSNKEIRLLGVAAHESGHAIEEVRFGWQRGMTARLTDKGGECRAPFQYLRTESDAQRLAVVLCAGEVAEQLIIDPAQWRILDRNSVKNIPQSDQSILARLEAKFADYEPGEWIEHAKAAARLDLSFQFGTLKRCIDVLLRGKELNWLEEPLRRVSEHPQTLKPFPPPRSAAILEHSHA